MYLDLYRLKALPFRLSPDASFLYASAPHQAARDAMASAVARPDGIVVIVGDIDVEKTRAAVAQRAADDLLHLAFVEVNAGPEHRRRLKLQAPSSKLQAPSSKARRLGARLLLLPSRGRGGHRHRRGRDRGGGSVGGRGRVWPRPGGERPVGRAADEVRQAGEVRAASRHGTQAAPVLDIAGLPSAFPFHEPKIPSVPKRA